MLEVDIIFFRRVPLLGRKCGKMGTKQYAAFKPLCQGKGKRNTDKSEKYCPAIYDKELIDTSNLVGFRKSFSCEGISENASCIITNPRRKGTLSNYESA